MFNLQNSYKQVHNTWDHDWRATVNHVDHKEIMQELEKYFFHEKSKLCDKDWL